MHRTVTDIHSFSALRHEATQASLESIDTRLKGIERELRQSIAASQRPRNSRNWQKIRKCARVNFPARASKVEPLETIHRESVQTSNFRSTELFRVIRPGYLFYDEDGKTKIDLVALRDNKFDNADINTQLRMIEYLKNLRLIVWLLKKQNYLSYTESILGRIFRSGLASQASLTSKWLCSMSCEYLINILPERAYMLDILLPWTTRKPWLQYIFDSTEDRDMDGEMIELVLSRWSYFPRPVGERGEYYLKVPHFVSGERVRVRVRMVASSRWVPWRT